MYKLDYKEEPIKDYSARKDYLDGINSFLSDKRISAENARNNFVTPAGMAKDRENYRQKYRDMLGYPLNANEELPVSGGKKTFICETNGVKVYRTSIVAGGIPVYGMYFETDKNLPFVVCFHGGEGTPELVSGINLDSANYNHLAQRIIERGANVYCPQTLLWNSDRYGVPFNRQETDGKLRQLGGSITALEVLLTIRAIDYFIGTEGVNAERIGVAGLSYGGMYALALAAADTRVKVCLSSSQFNDRFIYSWADWSYRGAQYLFTDAETAGLVAPRALCIAVGDKDGLFDCNPAKKQSEKVEAYFKAANSTDKFDFYVFDGQHETDKSPRGIDFLFNNI